MTVTVSLTFILRSGSLLHSVWLEISNGGHTGLRVFLMTCTGAYNHNTTGWCLHVHNILCTTQQEICNNMTSPCHTIETQNNYVYNFKTLTSMHCMCKCDHLLGMLLALGHMINNKHTMWNVYMTVLWTLLLPHLPVCGELWYSFHRSSL